MPENDRLDNIMVAANEATERLVYSHHLPLVRTLLRSAFIEGANWQLERLLATKGEPTNAETT